MKSKRQEAILEIIEDAAIETQEQLLQALRARGYQSTQATISRDIKELHLVKEQTRDGTYRYAASLHRTAVNLTERLRTIFREAVTSFDLAQNLVVIKTMPGLAGMHIPGMVGTLAGDDTAILIMRTNEEAREFCSEIQQMLK